jgi:hypothetical protein
MLQIQKSKHKMKQKNVYFWKIILYNTFGTI